MASTSENEKSRLPPPLPYVVATLLGLGLGWLFPLHIAKPAITIPVGLVFIAIAVLGRITITRAFKAHETPWNPYQETTSIVESGPFRFSRNPIYVMLACIQLAVGFLFNNLWVIALLVPALLVVHFAVVLGEERYLERKFGQQYVAYKSRVRRWI